MVAKSQAKSKAISSSAGGVHVHGGNITIQVYNAPSAEGEGQQDAASRSVRVLEIHNEVSFRGLEEGEEASEARNSVTGGTIIIEVHNETQVDLKSRKGSKIVTKEGAISDRKTVTASPKASTSALVKSDRPKRGAAAKKVE